MTRGCGSAPAPVGDGGVGADGAELWTHRIDKSPLALGLEIEKAGPAPEVVLEATWGWYWAADMINQERVTCNG